MRTALVLALSVAMWSAVFIRYAHAGQGAGGAQAAAAARPTLDYAFFKTRVQPIFLNKRPGHARCVSCHSSGTPMRLQPLSAGETTWNDEESRKNFDVVRRVAVVPGSLKSMLLIHPLEEQAGGDFFHNGGKHFMSQNDPEWQTLKAFVMGQTAGTN
jgi:hypothetical protein